MSFKWKDQHMELFLETYKQYECLWNNKCINYSKPNEREKAYLSMLNDLKIPGLTVGDIKAKIKTIRTRYGAELSKIRNSELNVEAGGEVYVPRLFWFKDADQFLRNVCPPKPNCSIPKDNEMSFETDQHTTQLYNGNDTADSPDNSTNSPVTTSFLNPTNSYANARHRKNQLKRSLPTNNASVIGSPIKKLKLTLEEEDDKLNDPNINEFDYFCKSLAIQLKRMPLQRAIVCQEKLQNVMTKERLFQLSEPYLSSLPISDNDDDDDDDRDGIQNQSSEHNSVISSTEPALHPIIDDQQFEMKLEDESEYISEVKKEIEEVF
ncbi:uncharacterized protein LOC129946131 [Eupeodes corollae]|uniref:uncharacterized protein LOC129946131 n=1 Tax=Eupeodes corollae TaxID=290404 RepID=UPI0024935B69|nr:uncharacterized protein LOC129946131 [Eupeodes corollae]